MEEFGNSMHNTDNPVTLSGLNSKLIIRGVLFYTLLIGFGLLSAQFVMSLLTINLEFYFSNSLYDSFSTFRSDCRDFIYKNFNKIR